MLIYKITPQDLWRDAQASGELAGGPADQADGFLHFSTAEQLPRTAAKHFSGQQNLLLIAVEAEALGEELKWESGGDGTQFPHLYRALSTAEAVWARPLALGPDGAHQLPPLD